MSQESMKDMYCTFYIVRHGETEWNVQGIIKGSKDSPLTEIGIVQAKDLARKLDGISFDATFSSPSGRARATADILSEEKTLVVMAAEALRERGWGKFEGVLVEEMKARIRRISRRYEDAIFHPEGAALRAQFGIEHDDVVVARVIVFLREVAMGYAGKTVLMVTHAGVMRTLLMHLGYASHEHMPSIDNAAYIKLRSDGIDFFIDDVSGVRLVDKTQ